MESVFFMILCTDREKKFHVIAIIQRNNAYEHFRLHLTR